MIVVDAGSALSAAEQIRQQLAELIAQGELAIGSKLPTVRSLAADLGVPPATVGRAYTDLERAGLIVTGRRQGSRVASPSDARRDEIASAARDVVRDARGLGMTDDEIAHLLAAAL